MPWLNRLRSLPSAAKWSAITLMCVAAIVVMATLKPIPQPLSYHNFADTRHLLGIPRAFDVLSNLPFLILGLLGLVFVLLPGSTLESPQRWAYAVLFAGLFLTGIGSAYYHLAPDNQRLVADRLPMTVVMAGFITVLLCDRVGPQTFWILPLLLMMGVATVLQWNRSEQQGHGDLRWYGLYQGLTILLGLALLLFFASRTNRSRAFVIAVAANIAAKIFELLDKPIYQLGGVVSGHTLKHLSAGLGFLPLVIFVYRKIGRQEQAVRGQGAYR